MFSRYDRPLESIDSLRRRARAGLSRSTPLTIVWDDQPDHRGNMRLAIAARTEHGVEVLTEASPPAVLMEDFPARVRELVQSFSVEPDNLMRLHRALGKFRVDCSAAIVEMKRRQAVERGD